MIKKSDVQNADSFELIRHNFTQMYRDYTCNSPHKKYFMQIR